MDSERPFWRPISGSRLGKESASPRPRRRRSDVGRPLWASKRDAPHVGMKMTFIGKNMYKCGRGGIGGRDGVEMFFGTGNDLVRLRLSFDGGQLTRGSTGGSDGAESGRAACGGGSQVESCSHVAGRSPWSASAPAASSGKEERRRETREGSLSASRDRHPGRRRALGTRVFSPDARLVSMQTALLGLAPCLEFWLRTRTPTG